jgi:penicillin-binding protein 1A
MGAVYAYYARDLPSIEDFGAASLSQVTRVLASDGKTLLGEHYNQNRTVVDLGHIAHDLRSASIAVEDKDFYSHGGFDVPRVVGAAIYDVTHRQAAQGASTITQQVVKSALLKVPERSFSRKIKELILATQLEAHYSKDRILEMYLNAIYYGNGAYGIETAAQMYFHKHAKDLTLAEASFLAGIPQSPGRFDPYTDGGFALTRNRQHEVLQAMVSAGYINQSTAESAFTTNLAAEIKSAAVPAQVVNQSIAPHFTDYILAQLREKYGGDVVDRGLTVTTTLDPHAQDIATRAVNKEVDEVGKRVTPCHCLGDGSALAGGPNTGAMMVVSPRTGAILAMVGSRDYNDKSINGDRNLVVDDKRQVGSTFKAYTYATALANGYTPYSTLLDANPNFPCYGGHQPVDFDGHQLGNISLTTSLQLSRNISSIRLFDALGAHRVFATAEALGIPAGDLTNSCESAALGTNELRMIDHVAAFSAFANGGRRIAAWAIARVVDSQGRVLDVHTLKKVDQAIPASVAMTLTHILEGAVPADYQLRFPVAAKSGTTQFFKDSWFIGYTSDLVVGAWMGRTDKGGDRLDMNTVYGPDGAGLIMRDYFKSWYSNYQPPDFGSTKTPALAPCRPAEPRSPSPSTSARSSASPTSGPSPSPSPTYPRAPYQYPEPSPNPGGASPRPCPSFGFVPSNSGTYAGESPSPVPESPPPQPIITAPSPNPGSSPRPSACVVPPLCH